ILSERHCEKNFAAIDAIARHRRGVIVISDDLAAVKTWSEASREDIYVELTPGPRMHEAVKFARALKLPPVATNKVHFVKAEDYALHRLLRAIDLNATLSRVPESECCAPDAWLMPLARLERYYAHVSEALANASAIAAGCRSDWDFKETIFPAFRALSDAEAFALLKEKTYAGARRRPARRRPGAHRERACDHPRQKLQPLFPHRGRDRRRPHDVRARLGRGLDRLVRARHHRRRSGAPPAPVRALSDAHAQRPARHRRRFSLGRARRRSRVGVRHLRRQRRRARQNRHGRQPEYARAPRRAARSRESL